MIYVILNPIAGHSSADELRQAIEKISAEKGMEYEIYETTGEEKVADVARAACEKKPDMVIAAGGDGTVSEVVNGLINSSIPLGIIPVGTGNALARSLSIPLKPEEALALLMGPNQVICLDAMKVGKQYYVLNVSAGISSRAMRDTPPERKRRYGVLAYVWTILKEVIGFEPRRFRLEIDGHEMIVRATEILISNGAMLREPPFPLGPRKMFNDGTFDVYVLTARSIGDYLSVLWNLILRPKEQKSDLHHFSIKEKARIEAVGRRQPAQADGEVIGYTPVDIEMVRDALSVIVPELPEEQPEEADKGKTEEKAVEN